ncbi:DsrE family protein [Sulfurospirillum sp. 1612]|uniref:DsrE family protein n=1 Tax=Sulfurospirillum sp. 1612 TaxID=3094835 RepID=UPI002F924242
MKNELMVVWTTDNKETIHHMVFLYTLNAKLQGWFDEVTLLIWGASQRTLIEDTELQMKIKEMSDAGVNVKACQKCSEDLGIKDTLQSCGVEVFYTGVLLSDWLKSGKPIITI